VIPEITAMIMENEYHSGRFLHFFYCHAPVAPD
jgi:hypothetical protein